MKNIYTQCCVSVTRILLVTIVFFATVSAFGQTESEHLRAKYGPEKLLDQTRLAGWNSSIVKGFAPTLTDCKYIYGIYASSEIVRIDVDTGTLQTVGTMAGGVNTLAVDENRGIIYAGEGKTIYYYDLNSNATGTVGTFDTLPFQFDDAGGSWKNGYLYLSVDNVYDDIYRFQLTNNGLGIIGSPFNVTNGALTDLEWGDFVVRGSVGSETIIFSRVDVSTTTNYIESYDVVSSTSTTLHSWSTSNSAQIAQDSEGNLWVTANEDDKLYYFNEATPALEFKSQLPTTEINDLANFYCISSAEPPADILFDCGDGYTSEVLVSGVNTTSMSIPNSSTVQKVVAEVYLSQELCGALPNSITIVANGTPQTAEGVVVVDNNAAVDEKIYRAIFDGNISNVSFPDLGGTCNTTSVALYVFRQGVDNGFAAVGSFFKNELINSCTTETFTIPTQDVNREITVDIPVHEVLGTADVTVTLTAGSRTATQTFNGNLVDQVNLMSMSLNNVSGSTSQVTVEICVGTGDSVTPGGISLNATCRVDFPPGDADGLCWVVSDSSNELVTYNLTTDAQGVVGSTGVDLIEAIAFGPNGQVLYAADAGTFGTLNLTTGSFSAIGSIGSGTGSAGSITYADVDGLSYSPQEGVMYGTVRRSGNDLLIKIDIATGQAISGAFGANDYVEITGATNQTIDDIVIDRTNGNGYVSTNETNFYSIDLTTGVTTLIGAVGVPNIEGLGTDDQGNIFATVEGSNELIEINKGTGMGTLLGVFTTGGDYEAIDCVPQNLLPEALDNTYTTPENTAVSGNALTDETGDGIDNQGDAPATVVSNTNPANGSVVMNPDGSFTYTPNNGFVGTDCWNYTIEDSNGDQSTAEVCVTTENVPVNAVDDLDNPATEGVETCIDVLGNDDTGSGLVSITITGAPTGGTAYVNASNQICYTAAPGTTTDQLTYEICDSNDCDTAIVTFDVNLLPEALDNDYVTDENVAVSGNALTDETGAGIDDQGDAPATVISNTAPSNGTLTDGVNPDGTFTYQPNPGFTGTDSFDYTIEDDNGDQSTATVTITISPDPVNAVDDLDNPATEGVEVCIDVLANDDTGSGLVSITITGAPTGGTAYVNASNQICYTAAPGTTTDQLTYEICDSNDCDTAIVTFDVNLLPEALDNDYVTDENVAVSGNALTDETGAGIDDQGDAPTTVVSNTAPSNGTLTDGVNPDGTFTYQPNPGFTGTDSFDYTIEDDNGDQSTATVTITISPDPVVAVDDLDNPATEGVETCIDVLGNDDTGSGLVSITITGAPTGGTAYVNSSNQICYTAASGTTGDQLTYEICDANDCDTAVVDFDVNLLPEALDNDYVTDENVAVSGNALTDETGAGIDDQGDAPATVVSNTAPSNGTLTDGVNLDGTFTYQPNPGFTGTDSFDYTIEDDNGDQSTATVTITISPDPVVAVDDLDNPATEGVETCIDVLTNDDTGSGLVSITITGAPTGGTAYVNSSNQICYTAASGTTTDELTYEICDANDCDTAVVDFDVNLLPEALDNDYVTDENVAVSGNALTDETGAGIDDQGDAPATVVSNTNPANGSVVMNPDGSFTYTPNNGFVGIDCWNYTIEDSNGDQSTAEVCVTTENVPVNAVDDLDNPATEGVETCIDVLTNDDTGSGLVSITITGAPTGGTAYVNSSNQICYTAASGTTGDQLTYEICDANDCDTAVVDFDVNLLPEALDNDYVTDENVAVSGNALTDETGAGIDDQGDAPATVVSNTAPSNGTLTDGVNLDGTFTYQPNPGFTGTDTFDYTIEDNNGDQSTATVTITISPDPVVAVDDLNNPIDEGVEICIPVLVNDDTGSGLVSINIISAPTGGSAYINANNEICYISSAGTTNDQLTYEICDSNDCDTAVVDFNVNLVPVALPNDYGTEENTPVNGNALGDDTGAGADDQGDAPATVIGNTAPSNGTLTVGVNPDGSFTYTPNPGFVGQDCFNYTIEDSDGDQSTSEVCINVAADPVIAVDDLDNPVDEGEEVCVSILANDDTGSGLIAGYPQITTQPTGGTAYINAFNQICYTPDPGTTTDQLVYEICDSNDCDEAVVDFNVNFLPEALDNDYITLENTPVSGNALADETGNGIDDQGDAPATVISNTDPTNGTVAMNPDGSFTYTPNTGFAGVDCFDYTIEDTNGDQSTAEVCITVEDDPVIAVDDLDNMIDEGTELCVDVLGNDDPGSGLVSITIVTAPGAGDAYINAANEICYTPDPGTTSDQLVYEICDTNDCDQAVVDFDVNMLPEALDNDYVTDENVAVSGNALIDDTGAGIDDQGDAPATVVSNTAPSNGTLTDGVNLDGTFTYQPNPGFTGTDTFDYTIEDDNGDQSTATVTITISPDPVVAVDDLDNPATEGVETCIDVLTNDDTGSGLVSITITGAPTGGTAYVNASNQICYTAAPGTTTDQLTYEICDSNDCDTAIVTFDVNLLPEALDNDYVTDENVAVSGNALTDETGAGIDDQGDAPATVISNTAPSNGTLTDGVNPDGTFTYQPNPGFTGTDSFDYTIEDDNGDQSTATVTITISPDPVNAVDDLDNPATEGVEVCIDVLANDDTGSGLVSITITGAPTGGTAYVNSSNQICYTAASGTTTDELTYEICDANDCDTAVVDFDVNLLPEALDNDYVTDENVAVSGNALTDETGAGIDDQGDAPTTVVSNTAPSNGTLTDGVNPDGTFTYQPNPGFTGTDTFDYTIEDDNGDQSTATVTITISPDPVVAVDDLDNPATEGVETCIDVLTNDDTGSGLVSITITGAPTGGTAYVNSSNQICYTAASGTTTDELTYEICDSNDCDTAIVTFIANTTEAIDDFNNTPYETPVNGQVLTNDEDLEGDTQTVNTTPVSDPTNGSVVINPDGTYTYTPDAGFSGEDTFEYEICDDGTPVACDVALVTIEVLPPLDNMNNPPVANPEDYTTPVDTPVSGSVLPNDFDPDGDVITPVKLTDPTNGTVVFNPDGTFEYTPDPDFIGEDVFEYEICDPDGLCDQTTVTITIIDTEENTTTAVDDAGFNYVNNDIAGSVLDNDDDPQDDNIVSTTKTSDPVNGTVVFNPDGTYVYTPNLDFVGNDQFTYEICDDGTPVACDEATVYLTITPLPNTTLAIDDFNVTPVNMPVDGNVLTNDRDFEGDNITVNTVPVSDPTNGTVTLNADGSYTYTPDLDFTGEDTFEYEICDDGNPQACDIALVTILIIDEPVVANNPPVANPEDYTTPLDTPISGSVLPNDFDPDGDVITPTKLTDPTDGTVVFNPDGTFMYTPNPGFTGQDEFTYEICDPFGLCDETTVTIHVTANVDNTVVAVDDAGFNIVNNDIPGNVLDNDTDPQGDNIISVTQLTNTVNGTVVFNPDGSYVYTPDTDFVGNDSFTYAICDDGTPQACDVATVYLTITPLLAPDLTPIITLTPNVITGLSTVAVTLEVVERLGNDTDGLITVRVPRDDSRWNITWDPTLTDIAFMPLDNPDWTYDDTSAFFHIWTSTTVIAGGDTSVIGFASTYDPQSTDGSATITVIIRPFSGEENNITNNVDAEDLFYFQ